MLASGTVAIRCRHLKHTTDMDVVLGVWGYAPGRFSDFNTF